MKLFSLQSQVAQGFQLNYTFTVMVDLNDYSQPEKVLMPEVNSGLQIKLQTLEKVYSSAYLPVTRQEKWDFYIR